MIDPPKVSMEMIDFQNDGFGAEIEKIIAEIKDFVIDHFKQQSPDGRFKKILNKLTNPLSTVSVQTAEFTADTLVFTNEVNKVVLESKIADKLEKLIFERLGLNVEFDLATPTHGAMIIMPVTDHHILLHDLAKNSLTFKNHNRSLRVSNKDEGKVDLHKAKLSGMFSKYRHKLYMDFGLTLFADKLTPAEVTAIILHELGHGFTYYEYSNRINATNQIVATIAEELIKPKEKRNYTYIYTELKNKLELEDKQIDDLLNTENKNILAYKFFLTLLSCYYKQSRTGKYEETSSEQLADQFANRFGYGRALISGLDKVFAKYSPERNKSLLVLKLFFEIVLIISAISVIITKGILPILFNWNILLIFALTLIYSGEKLRDMTYDTLKQRYMRVRLDIVQLLKQKFYSEEDTKALIESIKFIDAKIEEAMPYLSIFTTVSNAIFPYNWSVIKDINYEQLIERLMSNDLFLKAAELKNASA